METGIGEGSVLGPLIFLVCIMETSMVAEMVKEALTEEDKEAGEDLMITTCCFADDTTILLSTANDMQMQKAMEICSKVYMTYFSTVGMKVNQTKEEHIVFYPRASERLLEEGVMVGGRKEATSVKLLGVVVSQGWKFVNHVSKVISKASLKIAHVRKLRSYLKEEKVKMVAETLIMSVLKYGLEFCGRDYSNLVRLQKTYNVVLRLVTRSSRMTSVRLMLAKTTSINIKLQYYYSRMSLMRRVMVSQSSPFTLTFVKYPSLTSRTCLYQSLMPNKLKYGENSLVTVALNNLNSIGFGKRVQQQQGKRVQQQQGILPGTQWLKTTALKFLRENYDNGNLY